MTFPTVPSLNTTALLAAQADTSPTRTFPSLSSLTKNSGDLLVAICVAYQTSVTSGSFGTWGGGFTEIADLGGGTTQMTIGVATKWSTGSETGTFTVTQNATIAGHAVMILLAIPGAHATSQPEITAFASGTGTSADPAALTPSWGADDTLWIAVGATGETSTTGAYQGLTTSPTGFSGDIISIITADVVGGMDAGVGFQQLNAASLDAGPWTNDNSNTRNAAIVIAVRPAPSTPNPISASDSGTVSATDASTNLVITSNADSGTVSATDTASLVITNAVTASDSGTVSATDSASVTTSGGGNTPPTRVAYAETSYAGTGASKLTSTSVSWQTGDLIVALATTGSAPNTTLSLPTVTGLTFAAVGTNPTGGSTSCGSYLWSATAGSNGSGQIQANRLAGVDSYGMSVWVFRGSDGIGAVARLASTAKTVSLTRTQAASAVVEIMGDWAAGSVAGVTWTPTGQTQDELSTDAGQYSIYVADWGDQGAAGTTSYGVSGGSAGDLSKIAVEIKGTAGSSTPVSASDSGTVSVTESVAVVIRTSVSDSGTVSATDASSLAQSAFTRTDTGTVSATDASALAGSSANSDSGTVSATDASSVSVVAAATDSGTVSATEDATLVKNIDLTDSGTVSVTETAAVLVTTSASDSGTVSATESAYLGSWSIVQENAVSTNIFDTNTACLSYASESIPAFTRSTYYTPGSTLQISANYASAYTVKIYRLGWYGGPGARLMTTFAGTPTSQPSPVTIANSNGAVTCAAWSVTDTWSIPSNATPGWYWILLDDGAGGAAGIPFVVSDANDKAGVVVVSSEATWHAAYNGFGGNNLYGAALGLGSIADRALCVTYDKPVVTRDYVPQTHFTNGELAQVRFFERMGFQVGYTTIEQIDADPTILDGRTHIIFSGHNEYISQRVRDKVVDRIGAGVNIANFAGNDFFWRTVYGDTTGFTHGSHTGRVMWCKKDTMDGPTGSGHTAGTPFTTQADWMGTWQDTRWAYKNSTRNLFGDRFIANGIRSDNVTVPFSMKGSPIWRDCTGVQALTTGQNFAFGAGTAGMEWDMPDSDLPYVNLSSISVDLTNSASDINGETYNNGGTYTHAFQLVRNGTSIIFNANTTQWGWAVDDLHPDRGTAIATAEARQATLNILYDLGMTADSASITTAGLTVPTPVSDITTAYSLPTLNSVSASDSGTVSATDSASVTPSGGGGTYTVFGQPDLSAHSVATDTSDYTMGMQFTLSQDAALTGIWWYAHASGTQMPIRSGIYRVSDQTLVASHTSPSWSGSVGSGQWIKDTYDGSVTLLAGVAYKVVIAGGGGAGNWYTFYTHYWDGVGPGASGVTNGIITAPNNAGSDGGQDSYNSGSSNLVYPATSFNATNYWIDVEVSTGAATPVSASDSGTVSVTELVSIVAINAVTDSGTVSATEAISGAATVTASDSGTISATEQSSLGGTNIAASDSGTVSATETVGTIVSTTTTSDSGTISATDASASLVTSSLSDSGTVSATESAFVFNDRPATDSGVVSATESASVQISGGFNVSASDSGTVSVTEAITVKAIVDVTDSGTVSATDGSALAQSNFTRTDSGTVSATESAVVVILNSVSAADSGTVSATESASVIQITGYVVKVWNGTAFVNGILKVWNGTAFIDPVVRRWNGSAWV